ncbi:SGNH/GDSL hydrolase family protein [Coraliomargarita parva]|uniref:SGNH/GDSL hydrolase family protein n=1 Tax=Coraliomargarita parva TaxID=3014050 RepID=UPI0022B4890C|nr:SGNH/GDSL hydrolase family protein [Coraliomargarita parva]
MTTLTHLRRLAACVALLVSAASLHAEGIRIQSGQKLAFLGDSITQYGANNPSGYARLVKIGLMENGVNAEYVFAGISGHKSNQMLARLERDVLSKQPDWMTLSCGVNDVWHGERGVPLEDYKTNITEIVDRCEAAGVTVMILTATPIKEVPNELNEKLAGYNAFLRELAAERDLPLVDLNAAFWKKLNQPSGPRPEGLYLTGDGVHMNPLGDMLMAAEILKAFGLSEDQIAKGRTVWLQRPVRLNVYANVTVADYIKLNAVAADESSVGDMLTDAFSKDVEALIEAPIQ